MKRKMINFAGVTFPKDTIDSVRYLFSFGDQDSGLDEDVVEQEWHLFDGNEDQISSEKHSVGPVNVALVKLKRRIIIVRNNLINNESEILIETFETSLEYKKLIKKFKLEWAKTKRPKELSDNQSYLKFLKASEKIYESAQKKLISKCEARLRNIGLSDCIHNRGSEGFSDFNGFPKLRGQSGKRCNKGGFIHSFFKLQKIPIKG